MHKLNFLLSILFFVPLLGFAQNAEDDFEGNSTITSWYGDDCGMDNAYGNPFQEGINTSATVLQYQDNGGQYANIRFEIDETFALSQNAAFALKIYVTSSSITGGQPNQVSLKLQDGDLPEPWSTQTEIIKPIVLDQWQEVTFDFANDPYQNLNEGSPNPVTRTDFNRVVLQVNGENNNDLVTAYIDDFVYGVDNGEGSIYNQLVWADEFDGNGPIDPTKWHHQTQLPNGGSWFNNELQHYTNRVENSYVEDGFLHIVAKKENFTDQGYTKSYTSARLNSKFAFTYGRVEARAKLPFGLGTWPAIWMLGKNITEAGGYWANTYGTTGWPACGEIDIMEHWGYNQNYVQSALHTPSSFGATENHGGTLASDVSNTFHIYALEWTPEEMRFSIDGSVYYTYAPNNQNPATWPFDADQYLLLNVAIQGEVAGNFTQSPMVLDYIRVYQEGTNTTADTEELQQIQVFPNPVEGPLNITVPATLAGAQVKVYSAAGQVLVQEFTQDSTSLTLDWSGYPAGAYVLVFESGGERVSYKVVKI
ncbi:family 16 glycosylhydrolase [Lewinella cohaerens]|uniref:family 16 glycosylhydrolase n=1 Tax=Lewinella cohaerens TaxID=70995 RepID=UPI000362EF48|nr:family 16 glycosylhydrolase [Lewinella cohaerens]